MSFSIKNNTHLNYSHLPGGSFSGLDNLNYNLDETSIFNIEKESNSKIRIDFKTSEGSENHAWIKANDKEGEKQLKFILKSEDELLNQSYEFLINNKFNV